MLVFKMLEVPTPHGPAVIRVSGVLHRVPKVGPSAASGVVDLQGQHVRYDVAGQLVHARVPAAEFLAAFPEVAPLAGAQPWALVPLIFDAARRGAVEYPCRMAGPPTFGDPGAMPGG